MLKCRLGTALGRILPRTSPSLFGLHDSEETLLIILVVLILTILAIAPQHIADCHFDVEVRKRRACNISWISVSKMRLQVRGFPFRSWTYISWNKALAEAKALATCCAELESPRLLSTRRWNSYISTLDSRLSTLDAEEPLHSRLSRILCRASSRRDAGEPCSRTRAPPASRRRLWN